MTWTGAVSDVNVVLYGWLAWHAGRGGLRIRRERHGLETMERDRWTRLALAPSLDADRGLRLARAYLMRTNIPDRQECDTVTSYIVAVRPPAAGAGGSGAGAGTQSGRAGTRSRRRSRTTPPWR